LQLNPNHANALYSLAYLYKKVDKIFLLWYTLKVKVKEKRIFSFKQEDISVKD
jgi:hypothetical protein